MDVRSKLINAEKIVVKVGTTTLTYPNGKLNLERIDRLSRVLADLNNLGKKIILVSSGAIGVGAERLGLKRENITLPEKQAAASVGQAILMKIYQKFFEEYNNATSQILLTKDVMDNEERKENAQNTFNTLLDLGVLPIVNENDTISTYEIEFGDNDTLSATVAGLVGADLLILLTDIEGLYTADPKKDKNAKIIHQVNKIDDSITNAADGTSTTLGTGGMVTKISAAKIGCEYGVDTIIANGENPDVIYDIIRGSEVGTFFLSCPID